MAADPVIEPNIDRFVAPERLIRPPLTRTYRRFRPFVKRRLERRPASECEVLWSACRKSAGHGHNTLPTTGGAFSCERGNA